MHRSRETPAQPVGRAGRRPGLAAAAALVVFVVLIAAGVTACGNADATDQNQTPKRGGTLHAILGARMKHLDPQRVETATQANFSRLITRTLTTFRSERGSAASEIVGDLADDTGRPSDGNRVWDFRLKTGLRWQDGSPITCEDVRYGIERSFSNLLQVAQPYARQYLANTESYAGPFVANNNNGKGLSSVECVDQVNIRFHLRVGVGDFGYTLAMPVFAPVPATQDKKEAYDDQPFSSGPYKIEENSDKQLVLVRNPFWDPKTDLVRKAYPDRIVVTWIADNATVTNDLIQSEGVAADSIAIEKNVAPNFVQQVVNDPDLSRRAVSGSSSGIRYFAINTRTITDVRCRQALVYAFNKRKYRTAMGGAVFGDFAATMIAPQLKAHKDFDLYHSLSNVEGQPDVARQLMAQVAGAGKPCPSKITISFPDQKDVRRLILTIVESYQLIGVEAQMHPIDAATYYDVIGDPANGYDLLYAGWIPDWANGSAVIPPLFDGNLIPKKAGATNNQNFSLLNDPSINELIAQALAEPDSNRQYDLWGNLDEKIQALAATIPVIYIKALRMAGANVRGGFIHPQFGQPDMCALGLADPAKSRPSG
jgi:peptide/nickel transport system substrate-binding protein